MDDIKSLDTTALADILRNYSSHEQSDVKQAYNELQSRGRLKIVLDKLRREVRNGELMIGYETEDVQPFRDFNPSNPVSMRIGSTQQMVFEQMLIKAGIPYHRQEGLDVIVPLVNYYFNDRHRAQADRMERITHNYVSNLPPDQLRKTSKKAFKVVLWVAGFFLVFIIITMLTKLL